MSPIKRKKAEIKTVSVRAEEGGGVTIEEAFFPS
jgi:hypothetical protein